MAEAHHLLTFAALDRQKGIPDPSPTTGEEYPLPAWYRAVCEIPLEELGVENLCIACRQEIHLEQVVPLALRVLQSEPLAGELYDGELLVSLKSVPPDYWSTHEVETAALRSVCEQVRHSDSTPNDVRRDVTELLTRMRSRSG